MDINFIPPADVELEKSILCQMLLDPVDAGEYLDALVPEDFYRTANRLMFEAMMQLSAVSDAIGAAELVSTLKSNGSLEKVGGAAYISSIMDQIPPMSTDFAISTIRQFSVRRRAIEICNAGIKRALSDPDAKSLVDYMQAETMLLDPDSESKSSCVSMRKGLEDGLVRWEKAAKNPGNLTGVRSGIRKLDYVTCGFQKTDLIILAARPSMGKTAMSIGWSIAAANTGNRVMYFSLEQSSGQLVQRAVASETQLNTNKFKTGHFNPGDMDNVRRAVQKMSPLPILIDDAGGVSVGEIRRRARRADRRGRLGLIIIDHLQLITSQGRRENRNNEIGDMTRALKAMAKELEVPVVVLSQLNRNLESRPDKRPRLSDLRESGNIEQDADLVIFLYRPEHYGILPEGNHFEGYTEISLAKHRDGAVATVTSKFNPRSVRFYDVEESRSAIFGT